MLFWPSVTVVGFLVLAALVVALGRSSTERYEFERNRVQAQREMAAAPPAAVSSGGQPAADHAPAGGPQLHEEAAELRSSVSVATHPAGRRVLQPGGTPGWWLVDEPQDRAGSEVVAGPFTERMEAEWAALSDGRDASPSVVYGMQRADGSVVRRQSPQERAWLSELGEQLDRLPEAWDALLPDDEDDVLVSLVVEVAAALVEAGLPLHDCAGGTPSGGVCLSPEPDHGGVLVGWHQHERMSLDLVRGAETDAAVQRTLNAAVADCLRQMGLDVQPFGATGCSLVVAAG